MRRIRIQPRRRPIRPLETPLSLDPRDPDVVRAKRLRDAAREGSPSEPRAA